MGKESSRRTAPKTLFGVQLTGDELDLVDGLCKEVGLDRSKWFREVLYTLADVEVRAERNQHADLAVNTIRTRAGRFTREDLEAVCIVLDADKLLGQLVLYPERSYHEVRRSGETLDLLRKTWQLPEDEEQLVRFMLLSRSHREELLNTAPPAPPPPEDDTAQARERKPRGPNVKRSFNLSQSQEQWAHDHYKAIWIAAHNPMIYFRDKGGFIEIQAMKLRELLAETEWDYNDAKRYLEAAKYISCLQPNGRRWVSSVKGHAGVPVFRLYPPPAKPRTVKPVVSAADNESFWDQVNSERTTTV